MKRFLSSMLVIVLLAPGVALAEQGTIVERTPEYWYSYAEKLPIGATVRVRTTDGKRHTAVLALVDRDGITVEPKSRIPEPARRFPYDQIQQLELKTNGSSMAKAVAIGAGIGAGTFIGLLALLAASWD
jgi:hypothetical protein